MMFLTTSGIKSKVNHKKYCEEITKKYDEVMAIINGEGYPELSQEIFAKYGIYTLSQLNKYLEEHAEYGGYVHMPWQEGLILLPFHNDFMNDWLRFDNPRVLAFYERLYQDIGKNYNNRHHFECEKFNWEEDLQKNNWSMPALDEKLLIAPITGCWDRMEITGLFLELQGYEVRRLCCHDGIPMRGHTFVVYNDGHTWRTCLGTPINYSNKDYDKFCKKILNVLKYVPIYHDRSKCELIEFPKPYTGMPAKEYIESIESGTVVAHQ